MTISIWSEDDAQANIMLRRLAWACQSQFAKGKLDRARLYLVHYHATVIDEQVEIQAGCRIVLNGDVPGPYDYEESA